MRCIYLPILCIMLFCLAPAAGASLSPEALRLVLEERVASGANRGFVAVHVQGRQASFLSVGKGEDNASPLGADTLFETGSVTKVFTGILLADAVLREEVDMNAPLRGYLPRDVSLGSRKLGEVTLADLATHSSGLSRMPPNWEPRDPAQPYADFGEAELLQALAMQDPGLGDDGGYLYSNYGAGLLGYILERVTGRSYPELLAERVTGPLGMEQTVVQAPPALLEKMAQGFSSSGEPAAAWSFGVLQGCGGVDSTAQDMARFLEANLQAPRDSGMPLQAAEALSLAQRPIRPGPAESIQMGLGWHILTLQEQGEELRICFHDGGTAGHRAFVGFSPGKGVGVALFSNTSTDISDIGLNALSPVVPLSPPAVVVSLPPEKLEEYAGRYRFVPEGSQDQKEQERAEAILRREEGTLVIQVQGQEQESVLLPVGGDEFVYDASRDAAVVFERDDEGAVQALRVVIPGESWRAERQ